MTALRIDPEDEVAACALAKTYTQFYWECRGQTDEIIELWSRLGAVRRSALEILEPGLAYERKEKRTDKISEWESHRRREAKTRLHSARLLMAMTACDVACAASAGNSLAESPCDRPKWPIQRRNSPDAWGNEVPTITGVSETARTEREARHLF
jgi:hypothetical protein